MVLIIGGAYQGKRAYAMAEYPACGFPAAKDLTRQELMKAKGICNLEEFLEKELLEGKDLSDFAGELYRQNPDVVLTVREVGSGIVPIEPFERQYRETVGRVCTELASYAGKVVRVCCGLPLVLKDETK